MHPKQVLPVSGQSEASLASFKVRGNRDADLDMQLGLAPQGGRVFLDTLHKPDVGLVHVLTDTKLYHQQTLPQHLKVFDLFFEDGFGFLPMEDGALERQLWVSDDQRLFVADRSHPEKSQLSAWTTWAQQYTVTNIALRIQGARQDFDCYVLKVRRGSGCNVVWRASDFYGALGVHGYAAGSSKWIYDRWRGWEIAMTKHWAGQHLFKSMSSKKASAIATSDTCFLPSAGISTMAVMALMHRLAFAKAKNWGAGTRAAWSSTGSFQ